MTNKNKCIDLSILGLCTVALLGVVMRSKIVFALPFINYNHLLEAHSHFTFGGWVIPALLLMMVYELLPVQINKKPLYQWLLGGIGIFAWGGLVAYLLGASGNISIILSTFFIFLTYIFGWVFIKDLVRAKLERSISLLAISSIICLLISSVGPFTIAYIFLTKSFNAILYRDALFTYLHFQYNGFFSLAIFALLFNYISQNITGRAKTVIYWFAGVSCASIIPSLFLSYLWQDPDQWFRIIAIGGSFLVLLSLILFLLSATLLRTIYNEQIPVIRFLVFISMASFMLKAFLQSLTILPGIGNAIFGNRPIIMGFLHLVFLGFTSLFILAFFTKNGWLNSKCKITKLALTVFSVAVLFNEALLISQGLVTMFIPGSAIFPWLLWAAAICLFAGTLLIGIARIQTKRFL